MTRLTWQYLAVQIIALQDLCEVGGDVISGCRDEVQVRVGVDGGGEAHGQLPAFLSDGTAGGTDLGGLLQGFGGRSGHGPGLSDKRAGWGGPREREMGDGGAG